MTDGSKFLEIRNSIGTVLEFARTGDNFVVSTTQTIFFQSLATKLGGSFNYIGISMQQTYGASGTYHVCVFVSNTASNTGYECNDMTERTALDPGAWMQADI